MEFQTSKVSVLGKILKKMLKLVFYVIRKGLASNTKLIMDIVLMIKKRRAVSKSPSTLRFLPHSKYPKPVEYGVYEYEFSCSNTPVPGYSQRSKKKSHFFPCISLPKVLEDHVFDLPGDVIFVPNPKTPEYKFNMHIFTPDRYDKRSPSRSPVLVRISNYSNCASDDESDEVCGKIDHRAEEFIERFYNQLRVQY